MTMVAMAGLVATVAGFTFAAVSVTQAAGTPGKASSAQAAKHQDVTLYVLPGAMGFTGPDKQHHDTIAPADFVLHRGVPVTFTVINHDDGMHTIFAPELDLNITIEAGVPAKNADGTENEKVITPTTTTYTFTPQQRGEFRWQCVVMCDGPSHWAMSDDYDGPGRDGFMAGWIKVL
jgi:heme/copper-type cytochrome/quinol oxidase subunit 2